MPAPSPDCPRRSALAAVCAAALFGLQPAYGDILTRLPTTERVVALTFDACEAGKPAHLDAAILTILKAEDVPFTVFMGGKFARDNAQAVSALAADPRVEIENHSWSHPSDMRVLSEAQIKAQVLQAQAAIQVATGRTTRFFRFPGGNADARTVAIVESLGYRVVHWRWPEGDPDPGVSAQAMVNATLTRARPGDILIMHVNGRGVHTAAALKPIIDGLRAKGFRFVRLSDYLPAS